MPKSRMPKKKRAQSVPRVTIYPNGRATLSGLDYQDLRSLLTQAALYNYDAEERAKARAARGERETSPDAAEHRQRSMAIIAMAEADRRGERAIGRARMSRPCVICPRSGTVGTWRTRATSASGWSRP